MPAPISEKQHRVYWNARQRGDDRPTAAQKAGFSVRHADTIESKARTKGEQGKASESKRVDLLPAPKTRAELCPEALRALDDFPYFQRRYFGRVPLGWQTDAAEKVLEFLANPEKVWVVINAPPGSGKTMLFTHDIPAWLTVRNRAIRGQMGSASTALATRYTNRLRRTLQATLPMRANSDDLALGRAFDADGVLALDYGRFQPLDRETWTADAFVVVQEDGQLITQKETTWSAYGPDASFIGGRFDFVIWDDMVDPGKLKTIESRQALATTWDDVCENRLDPGGLMILQGQRISSDDLYRHCLDKEVPADEESGEEAHRIYEHVMYPAHDVERCRGEETHAKTAPSWPDGCLISNWRLPWRELRGLMATKGERFEVIYQQQDVDPASVLVQPDWIHGRNGFIGCIDEDRDRLELPRNAHGQIVLEGDLFSVMAVDPSPTKFWAIGWFIYQHEAERRWLMDLAREPLDAGDFLDWNPDTQEYTGILEEWWKTSDELGLPITHVIVERNAAQRFLLQYNHVRNWMSLRGVEIIPHDTHRNKSDPELGVDTIASHYKFGRIRLPYKRNSLGWAASTKLIWEVTHYPGGRTDDCVMMHWFLEWQLPHIYSPPVDGGAKQWRPSWGSETADRASVGAVSAMESRRSGTMFDRAMAGRSA